MSDEILHQAVLPFLSVLLGAFVTYWSNRLLRSRQERRHNSVKLFEEFHSPGMLECRFDSLRVLEENPEGNIADLYKGLRIESYLPLSKLLHWFEKVAVYEKNKHADALLLRDLLGRYFSDWHSQHYGRLATDLPESSEFADMMDAFDYVAGRLGKESDARLVSRDTEA